jgi:GNAT superfamily N-acetyltransferase
MAQPPTQTSNHFTAFRSAAEEVQPQRNAAASDPSVQPAVPASTESLGAGDLAMTSELTTHTGFTFQIRSADPGDEPALAEFFAEVTEDDLRFRFLSAVHKVSHAQLAFLTHIDHRRTENVLAFDSMVGCVLASAMLAVDDDLAGAEVAIVIRSGFKNRGIGWRLLQHVSGRAADMGIKMLRSVESRENRSAIAVEREMGFTSRPYPGDSTLLLLEKTLITAVPGVEATVS